MTELVFILDRSGSMAGLEADTIGGFNSMLAQQKKEAGEALVLDSEGYITECCAANLLWRKGSDVFTPSLEQAGVNGIMRQFCMHQLARAGFRVVEVCAGEDALHTADEVVICNALMPVFAVRAYDQQRWSSRELFQFLAPICEQTR